MLVVYILDYMLGVAEGRGLLVGLNFNQFLQLSDKPLLFFSTLQND